MHLASTIKPSTEPVVAVQLFAEECLENAFIVAKTDPTETSDSLAILR
jgi:hypothetical protein